MFEGYEACTYGPGLTRVGMDHYLSVGYLGPKEVHLSLDHSQVPVGASLEDELPAYSFEVRYVPRVYPYVLGKDVAETSQYLVRVPSLPLLVHYVALEEDTTAHR